MSLSTRPSAASNGQPAFAIDRNGEQHPGKGTTRTTIDVVVVPDFRGNHAQVQEALTLLFLASWLEHQPAEGRIGVQIAAIGDVPRSIRRLSERAGAVISRHEPMGLHPRHHVGNKLRGLEVPSQADCILLLDTDTLVLSDLHHLTQWSPCLAAAFDDGPKLTRTHWERICHELDVPPSDDPAACLSLELGLPSVPRKLAGLKVAPSHAAASPPYYNGGAVMAPRGCGLRELWEESIRAIAALFPINQGEQPWIHRSDQAGLAVAMARLRQQQHPFRPLPSTVNCRWRHLYVGAPTLQEMTVLHLTTFLHDLPTGPLTPAVLRAGIKRYLYGKLRNRMGRLMLAEMCHGRMIQGVARYRRAQRTCGEVQSLLERLIERHVASVLAAQ